MVVQFLFYWSWKQKTMIKQTQGTDSVTKFFSCDVSLTEYVQKKGRLKHIQYQNPVSFQQRMNRRNCNIRKRNKSIIAAQIVCTCMRQTTVLFMTQKRWVKENICICKGVNQKDTKLDKKNFRNFPHDSVMRLLEQIAKTIFVHSKVIVIDSHAYKLVYIQSPWNSTNE